MTPEESVIARLVESLGQAEAAELAGEVIRTASRPGAVMAVVGLLDELHEVSAKIGRLVVEALPELRQRAGMGEIGSWLDLCVTMAGSSGAAAMKYVKESPRILGLIEPAAAREPVLALALELADSEPNAALDFLRAAPDLLAILPVEALPAWGEIGVELARYDYVLGIEFFKQCPSVAGVIPLDQVRDWVAFGMKLITRNSLGKTDYLGTLEFFRNSPAILGDVEGVSVRKCLIDVGSVLADRDPETAVVFLAESPGVMRRLPTEDWRLRVLRYGALVAERDAPAALACVRRCPEIVALIGETAVAHDKFEDWFRGGMETLEYSAEGARAYFSLETQKALASVEQAMSGIPLRQVARQLKLFAQGLCGTDVTIQALPESVGEPGKEPARARVSPDGRTIMLPAILRRYPTREENVRLYTVMTAHEAGHLEFGTYGVSLRDVADLIADVTARYSRAPSDVGTWNVQTLQQVFDLYPQPGLIRDLWTILEDARVEYLLQQEYPGLKRGLAALAEEAVAVRSFLHGMSVREMVVDCLLLLSTRDPGAVPVPDAINAIVEQTWALCQGIRKPASTAEDAIRLADGIYVLLEKMVASAPDQTWSSPDSPQEADQGAGPKASEEISGVYRRVTNWAYRGEMEPDLVRERERTEQDAGNQGGGAGREGAVLPAGAGPGAAEPQEAGGLSRAREELLGEGPDEAFAASDALAASIEQMPAVPDDSRRRHEHQRASRRAFLYDEWDGLIQDYRSNWCRVVEQTAPEGTADFVEATLAAHGPSVRLLRRYFESLRPPGLRRSPGQPDGEEVDLEAAIRRVADRAAGAEASDRIYIRREKRERDVAVAFLVDLSGSTSRQVEGDGRRVIDVEKEGLVLLCEALAAVGDQYAVYGYSGRGRHEVEFHVVKDFDEMGAGRVARRIGSVVPLQQNRDGAAIRHATARLRCRTARTKLLVLMSDGRPLDEGYADEYSLQDTKMALKEACMRGIDPFCITVDSEASDYLRRMYGEVRFLIVDRVEALPERLPRIYRRLTA